jgi:3-hydroxyacyl-CoA dehydrogenase
MPSSSNPGEIMKILIVGAGIVAYGSAFAALNDGYEVDIVDHSIEFGLPNVWPSVLLDRNSIPLSFSNSIYQIDRQDGLTESWYVGDQKTKNRKVIEIIATMLPANQSLWDCSQRFQAGMDLWNTVR